MDSDIKILLQRLARQYETADFIIGDPSFFMHQVHGDDNQEAMALIASCFSYGSRKQFMPKIQFILDATCGEVVDWIKTGAYRNLFSDENKVSFYRMNSYRQVAQFLYAYQNMLLRYGSLSRLLRVNNVTTALEAVEMITAYFACYDTNLIPKNTASCCKRVCMFLRWMVREQSPVDLGLWSDFISPKSLIMPLDTHVLQQAVRLGLLSSKTSTMHTAIKLTDVLREVFPQDPLKADFALFGYGVSHDRI